MLAEATQYGLTARGCSLLFVPHIDVGQNFRTPCIDQRFEDVNSEAVRLLLAARNVPKENDAQLPLAIEIHRGLVSRDAAIVARYV